MSGPVRLVKIACAAEVLRLRSVASRLVVRLPLAVSAAILAVAGLAFLHIAMWYLLREAMGRWHTALVLGVGDLLLAVALGFLASRSAPNRIEKEALTLREQALASAARSMAPFALLVQVAGLLMFRMPRR